MKYDLELFLELNKLYESRPVVPRPRSRQRADIADRGLNRPPFTGQCGITH